MKTHGLLFCFLLLAGLSACNTSTPDKPETSSPAIASPDSSVVEPAKQDSAFQIIPGQRIGKISIGQSPEEVVKTLGPPDSSNAAMGKALLQWFSKAGTGPRQEVTVYTVRENTGMPDEQVSIRQIRVTSPQFTIPGNNLHTGSSLAQIKNAYPTARAQAFYIKSDQSRVYLYDVPRQGITFEVAGPDSTCVAITIHLKDKSIQEEYLPLHPDLKSLK